MSLDKKLLELLACPVCKGTLTYDEKGSRLTCPKCAKHYPIVDDIPDFVS